MVGPSPIKVFLQAQQLHASGYDVVLLVHKPNRIKRSWYTHGTYMCVCVCVCVCVGEINSELIESSGMLLNSNRTKYSNTQISSYRYYK